MQLLQPIFLWGLLGISIPILIHLWQGKKGQVLHWAAMHWLTAKESSVAKGIRLENIPVLLLRILLLVLLVLLLSQLHVTHTNTNTVERVIHLVQPMNHVTEEYKFELQQALANDEEVYWSDINLTSIGSLDDLKPEGKIDDIQAALNQIPADATGLNLYLSNSINGLKNDFYLSPLKPKLFLGSADRAKSTDQVITLPGEKKLVVNERGLLDSIPDGNESSVSSTNEKDEVPYFFGEVTDSERNFIQASLDAITEVYGLNFTEKKESKEAQLIFDTQLPTNNNREQLYFISDNFSFSEQFNLLSFPDQLDFEHSNQVQKGELPEVILQRFLTFSGVEKLDVGYSQAQLERRFLVENLQVKSRDSLMLLVLLGLFILSLAAERYLANLKGI